MGEPWRNLEEDLRFLTQRGSLMWAAPIHEAFAAHDLGYDDVPAFFWRDMAWWGPLEPVFQSMPRWSDICIEPPDYTIMVKEGGSQIYLSSGVSMHESWVRWLQNVMAMRSGFADADDPDDWRHFGKPVASLHGTVGRRLRYAITRPPYTPDGRTVSIRALAQRWLTLNDLVHARFLSAEAADMLVKAINAGVTLLIAGLTGSGKTTLAGALLQQVGEHRRLIIVEDATELPRPPYVGHSVEVLSSGKTFSECVRFCLRQDPDMIIVGEVRGPEALAMLEAAATGHPGLGTIHAADARTAIVNLERMAISDPNARPEQVRQILTGGNVPLLVVAVGNRGGRRCVHQIVEILPSQARLGDPIPFNLIFEHNSATGELDLIYPPNGPWFTR